jgi:anti-sigma factor RsiW
MTTELNRTWAWSQVESYVDGSLERDDRLRMERIVESDQALAAAVGRARQVQRALRRAQPRKPATSLIFRLLAVPTRPGSLRFFAAPVGALAVAFIVSLLVLMQPEPQDPAAEAAEEFALAMAYLQRSAQITRDEVSNRVGSGLVSALLVSRASMEDVEIGQDDDENGG